MKLVLCIMILSVFLIASDSVNAKQRRGYNIKNTFSGSIRYKIKVKKYDRDKDGYLSRKEIKKIKSLYLENLGGLSVKGISKLKHLKKIKIQTAKPAYNIKEVEKLHRLEDVYIDIEPKKKLVLDFRKSKKIKKLDIAIQNNKGNLKISRKNKIKYLSIGGIKNSAFIANKCLKAKKIHIFTNLNKGNVNLINRKYLEDVYLCKAKNLQNITVKNCVRLKKIKLNGCKSSSCTIENNSQLKSFKMFESKVSNLTVKSLKDLKWIEIDKAKVSNFIMDKLNDLRTIKLYSIQDLSDVNISNMSKLRKIDIDDVPQLKSLTVDNLSSLKELKCAYGSLSKLNIVGDYKLNRVEVYSNQLKTFSYNNLKNVSYLDIHNNQIEGRFDFTLYPKLYDFDCSNNRISEIYGGPQNREIGYINCSNNNMKLLQFTDIEKYDGFIYYVNCKMNPYIEVYAWMEDYDCDPTAKLYYK